MNNLLCFFFFIGNNKIKKDGVLDLDPVMHIKDVNTKIIRPSHCTNEVWVAI